MITWWKTTFDLAEIQKVTEAISNGHISQGPVTEKFERLLAEELGCPYVVATTSGSVAMLMALMAIGIKPNDEVIVPNRTWIATAHAVKMLGAKVVLVDVQPDLPIMEVTKKIKQIVTSRTKAIMPVHLNGRAVDMDSIREFAKANGLFIIEDAAQALFSKYRGKYCGTLSDAGCFSFSVAKLVPTGQGGAIAVRSKEIYKQLMQIRSHGVKDLINVTYSRMGFNFRITDLQSAIGISQLTKVKQRISSLNQVYAKYESAIVNLPFLKLIPVNISKGEVPLYVEVLCRERKQLVDFLASQDIQVRPFYPDLNCAEHFGIFGNFPYAKKYGEQGLVLPCGPDQSLQNIERVICMLELYGKTYQ